MSCTFSCDKNLVKIGSFLYLCKGYSKAAIYDTKTKDVYNINLKLYNAIVNNINDMMTFPVKSYFKRCNIDFYDRLFLNTTDIEELSHKDSLKLNFVWFEISSACNLKCLHCYAKSELNKMIKPSLSHAQWIKLLKDCYNLGARSCQFIGGEPLLYQNGKKDINTLIIEAKKIGYDQIEIFTNATLWRKLDLNIVTKYISNIKISFYSHIPEIHDSITKVKGSWIKTLEGIKKLKKTGIPILLHIIVQDLLKKTLLL